MWIELGKIDYKIIIPLIYPFLYEIRSIFHQDDERFIFEFFMNYCGYLFSGIFYLIIKFRMKNELMNTEIGITDDNNNEVADKIYGIDDVENPIELEKKRIEKKESEINIYFFYY